MSAMWRPYLRDLQSSASGREQSQGPSYQIHSEENLPHDLEADWQAHLLSALALFFSLLNALTSGLPQ